MQRKEKSECTLANFLQCAFGGMSRLEALLVLLGSAAVVVRLHCDGSHIAAAACFESEGNRRHFEDVLAKILGWCRVSAGHEIILAAAYR